MKYPVVFMIAGASLLAVLLFTAFKSEDDRFGNAKTEVLMREIGHTLLLQSGDSNSRVLPVKELTENEYQLSFESRMSLVPDSLVATIQRVISANSLPQNYIVNVLECASKEVIFGFAILPDQRQNVVPCVGRSLPRNCYLVNIHFQSAGQARSSFQKWPLTIALAGLLAGMIFLFIIKKKKKPIPDSISEAPSTGPDNSIMIGDYILINGELKYGEELIPLSVKETKILTIFASTPNQIIDRSRLQKEGWEDEGVIVGRSLDVFISKLRRKLEKDPAVKLVNIHGKGYKLVVS